jgi:P-type Ca2+ transporter type 2C
MLYYAKTPQETLASLGTTARGLSNVTATKHLAIYGSNVISVSGDPLWRKLVEPFANVFVGVLIVAAAISLWHQALLDAIIIFAIIIITAIIYYVQRFSTERVLRSLRKHDVQTVRALRDGKNSVLDASELVPGDIMLLREGDKVPADGRIIKSESLRVDESQLTGESVPVRKTEATLKGEKEVFDQHNMVFQGSFIIAGEATVAITATGNTTQFGHLAMLSKSDETISPVQRKIDRLITQIIIVTGGIAVVALSLSLLRGSNVADSIQLVLALAVSAVPESLPVAISVVLVLGMRRMAKKKALARSMRAIETIGVITTIATDKTGTLTKNQLTVQVTWQPSGTPRNLAGSIVKSINHGNGVMHDPLDAALSDYAHTQGVGAEKIQPIRSFPFDQAVAMSGNIYHHAHKFSLYVKGAPEQVLSKSDLTESELEQATIQLHALTAKGYRVLAVARRSLHKEVLTLQDAAVKNLQFDGFVAVADTLRPEAKRAIKAALRAGVSVRMITGDHYETAYHIGKELGLVQSKQQVFDSRKMHVISDEALEKEIENIRIFSRVTPEHKYRLLTVLKKHHITAMTGDGVNDVPALAHAHVGVAMGSGTSIAKDAGDLILVDDNFRSIVDAMREGRIIFTNIRRMLYYLLSTNAGEVLTVLGALLIGVPVPLLPVQILWINLVTDVSLVIPLGLEPGSKQIMHEPARNPRAPILSRNIIIRMILVALSMAAITIFVYIYFIERNGGAYAGTIAFSAMVAMQWANAISARSLEVPLHKRLFSINKAFITGLTIAFTLQLLVIFTPLGNLLHISPVAIGDLFIATLGAFVAIIVINEIAATILRRGQKNHRP